MRKNTINGIPFLPWLFICISTIGLDYNTIRAIQLNRVDIANIPGNIIWGLGVVIFNTISIMGGLKMLQSRTNNKIATKNIFVSLYVYFPILIRKPIRYLLKNKKSSNNRFFILIGCLSIVAGIFHYSILAISDDDSFATIQILIAFLVLYYIWRQYL